MEKCKNLVSVYKTFKNLVPQNYLTEFLGIAIKNCTNSPWECVIKVCSNAFATYIIGEIVAKDNLNIANLMQTLKIFFSETTEHNS